MKNDPIHERYEDGKVIVALAGKYEGSILMHSENHGFYVLKMVRQKREGRDWVTIDEVHWEEEARNETGNPYDDRPLLKKGIYRTLSTYRSVSTDQAMRLFLHDLEFGPGGLMAAMRAALDRAGVDPLKD